MSIELSRIDYQILDTMKNHKAVDIRNAITCYEISKGYKNQNIIDTVYRHLRLMEDSGLVTKGAKVGKANSYMLTAKAVERL
ncbi:MAG: hypothetical protein LUF92_03755 [Clostridiales bacterium]|nr:hypothetical protein [Clostridiales bacterium]